MAKPKKLKKSKSIKNKVGRKTTKKLKKVKGYKGGKNKKVDSKKPNNKKLKTLEKILTRKPKKFKSGKKIEQEVVLKTSKNDLKIEHKTVLTSRKNEIICILTGIKFIFSKAILEKQSKKLKFNSVEEYAENYICKDARKLLNQGFKESEVRKQYNCTISKYIIFIKMNIYA